MNTEKVTPVTAWPHPPQSKNYNDSLALQTFFNHCFISGFSSPGAPLTSLLRKASKILIGKSILKHTDPSKPFEIEVDASDIDVRAILSQQFGEKPKLHPVAYFSCKLTPAKQIYNVGDKELLAIKVALDGRSHTSLLHLLGP